MVLLDEPTGVDLSPPLYEKPLLVKRVTNYFKGHFHQMCFNNNFQHGLKHISTCYRVAPLGGLMGHPPLAAYL